MSSQETTDFVLWLAVHISVLSFSVLLVYGGRFEDSKLDDVKATSLSSQDDATCPPLADLPYPVDGITAASIDGAPVLCGGETGKGWGWPFMLIWTAIIYWRYCCLVFEESKTFRHFPILTLSNSDFYNSDTFQFTHFPIHTLSNSHTFQFTHFPILTVSN